MSHLTMGTLLFSKMAVEQMHMDAQTERWTERHGSRKEETNFSSELPATAGSSISESSAPKRLPLAQQR